jgi:hypothetical protein
MVWRRLRIAADTSLAAPHYIIQIVQGWDDDYLHQFHIYGKDYWHQIRRQAVRFQRFWKAVKRYLWHGNLAAALEHIDECNMYCDDPELTYAGLKSLQKYLDEMHNYIRNNQMMLPNYGEMHRYGESVSTAFVESTINEVIARRMAKKQQMQWSKKGAHYLLQTRTPDGRSE